MGNSFQEERDPPEVETLASLAENLVYRLPGCDDLTVRKALRDVYREFCRETKCLTAERRVELEAGRRGPRKSSRATRTRRARSG